ncbi:MAG: hypothetical protein K2W85_10665 [Phycisphaerales bacterium]|nr:hypothetical protein [Phycisphaerales bacterium]
MLALQLASEDVVVVIPSRTPDLPTCFALEKARDRVRFVVVLIVCEQAR